MTERAETRKKILAVADRMRMFFIGFVRGDRFL